MKTSALLIILFFGLNANSATIDLSKRDVKAKLGDNVVAVKSLQVYRFNTSEAAPIIDLKLENGKEVSLNFGSTCESYKNAIDFLSFVGNEKSLAGETLLIPPASVSELQTSSSTFVGEKDICNVKIQNIGGVISTCARQQERAGAKAKPTTN